MLSFLPGTTFADFIERRGSADPGRVFVTLIRSGGGTAELTFGELDRISGLAARALHQAGAVPGARVLILAPNGLEMVVAIAAAARSGLVSAPVNTSSVAAEIAYLAELLEPAVIIVGAAQARQLAAAGLAARAAELVVVIGGDAAPLDCARSTMTWDDFLASGEAAGPATLPRPQPGDLFQLLMTSGTTGRPKAVMHSHATRLRSAYRVVFHARMRDDDVVLNPFPAFHINCLDSALFPALITGARAVIFESFSAREFWPAVRREQATVVAVLPTVIRALSAVPDAPGDRDHRIRLVLGALRPARDELEAFLARFAIPRYETGYGLTEAGMAVTQTMSDLDLHYPSIGVPMFDRSVELVGEAGQPVPVGETGEIVVGPVPAGSVMNGYWRDPEATARAFAGGWLHTGDLARRDQDGFFYFVGRSKDVIKRSGENIGAEEVEAVLTDHPGIRETAVIGIPDAYRDEAVMAFIVTGASDPELTLADVREFCAGRIADFKIPSVVRVVSSLPRGMLGKVDKKALRALAAGHEEPGGDRHV
ncbi:MAG TPA: AMP-binding protein [Streptosporangiaceae bacterium]